MAVFDNQDTGCGQAQQLHLRCEGGEGLTLSVGGQAVRDGQAGGPGADDDVVIFISDVLSPRADLGTAELVGHTGCEGEERRKDGGEAECCSSHRCLLSFTTLRYTGPLDINSTVSREKSSMREQGMSEGSSGGPKALSVPSYRTPENQRYPWAELWSLVNSEPRRVGGNIRDLVECSPRMKPERTRAFTPAGVVL